MLEKHQRPRLKVLYISIVLLGATSVAACSLTMKQSAVALDSSITEVDASPIPTETIEPTPSETLTQPPTLTSTPFLLPTSTATPAPVCFHLLNPPDGSLIAEKGIVKFEWEPHPAAQMYLLEITVPDGHMLAFDTFNTSVERYLVTLPWKGTYTWQVAAMNPEGGVLCIAEPLSFNKPKFLPSPTPERNPPPPRNPDKPSDGGG